MGITYTEKKLCRNQPDLFIYFLPINTYKNSWNAIFLLNSSYLSQFDFVSPIFGLFSQVVTILCFNGFSHADLENNLGQQLLPIAVCAIQLNIIELLF